MLEKEKLHDSAGGAAGNGQDLTDPAGRREGAMASNILEFPSPGTPHRADADCQAWRPGGH